MTPDSVKFTTTLNGGPFDNTQLIATQKTEYPIFLAPVLDGAPRRIAIYEYYGNREGTKAIELVYRYVETLSFEEGTAFIQQHGGGVDLPATLSWQERDGQHHLIDISSGKVMAVVVTDFISGEWVWQRLAEPRGEGNTVSKDSAMRSAENRW